MHARLSIVETSFVLLDGTERGSSYSQRPIHISRLTAVKLSADLALKPLRVCSCKLIMPSPTTRASMPPLVWTPTPTLALIPIMG